MSTTIPAYINAITILQDAELAAQINKMKTNPSEYAAWLSNQQDQLYKSITQMKDSTFGKVYGDLTLGSNAQEAYLLQAQRNKDLSELQKSIVNEHTANANAVVEDKHMATRKHEMNEWSVNNKQDTLFVFSALFIVLSGLLLLTGLWRMGTISSAVWVMLGAPMIMVFLLILVRRYFYTEHVRNKRFWNKQIFEGTTPKIPIPSCEQLEDSLTSSS